jgi:hypothetical protein
LAEAPTIMDPTTTMPLLRLADVKVYAKSRAVSRRVLRAYLLRKVVAKNAIQFAKRVVGFDIVYTDDGERVKVFFDDGTHEVGDVLIAADGSKSQVGEMNNCTYGMSKSLKISRSVIKSVWTTVHKYTEASI